MNQLWRLGRWAAAGLVVAVVAKVSLEIMRGGPGRHNVEAVRDARGG